MAPPRAPRLLVAVLLLLAATLLIHTALLATHGSRGAAAPSLQPLCLSSLLLESSMLVAVPLLEPEAQLALRMIKARVERLAVRLAPCQLHRPVAQRPLLLLLTSTSKPSDQTILRTALQEALQPASSCFRGVELVNVGNASSERQHQPTVNAAFLTAFYEARRRRAALLWLSPETVPLRNRWLEAAQCELLSSAAGAWIVGSTLLMDCRHEWRPRSASCDRISQTALLSHRISATGLYAAADDGFEEYVREWQSSTLWDEPFHVALSALLWAGYHESRQRTLRRRFIASDLVLDFGDAIVSAQTAHDIEPNAALLHTTNTSELLDTGSEAEDSWLLLPPRSSTEAQWAHRVVREGTPWDYLHRDGSPRTGERPAGDRATERPAVAAAAPPPPPPLAAWGSEEDLVAKARRQADAGHRLIVSFASPAVPFALNQLMWFERQRMRNWLLVALDAQIHAKLCQGSTDACALAPSIHYADGGALAAAAARAAALQPQESSDLGSAPSPASLLLGAAVRVGVLIRLADAGLHIFACDADSILLRDPWPNLGALLGLAAESEEDDGENDGDGDGGGDGSGDDDEGEDEGGSGESGIDLLLLPCEAELCRQHNQSRGTLDAVAIRAGSSFSMRLLSDLGHALVRLGSDGRLGSSVAPSAQATWIFRQLSCEALATALRDTTGSSARWQLLNTSLFVSYGALVRRPPAGNPADSVVLASTSGAVEAESRRYALRESRLWLLGDGVSARGSSRREDAPRIWLGYDVADSDCALYRQRRALRSALMMAHVLHRSLLLPRFCSHADGGRSVPMSFLFDYASFAKRFPHHAEASALRYLVGDPATTQGSASDASVEEVKRPPLRFHIALADAPAKKSASALQMTGSFKAKSPKGASEGQLRSWLRKWSSQPLLWFDKTYQRLNRLDDLQAAYQFEGALREGLRPAPELRVVIEEIVSSLRTGVLSGAGFNCVQVSQGDLMKNGAKIFNLGARVMNSRDPTLLADASLVPLARSHMRQSFRRPLFLSDLLPEGSRSLFEDANGRLTLAYELVEMHVCAAADEFGGNMLTPYAHAVCFERDGMLPAAADTSSSFANAVKNGQVRKRCHDLYGRDEETIKSSRTGRGWF